MEYVFHNFNLLIFATKLILNIKNWLSCVAKYVICDWEINSWNYRSGRMS